MRVHRLKQIDTWGGLVACSVLALAWPFLRSRRTGVPVRKILVIKFWGIGSLTMASYLLRALRREEPEAEVHLLTLSSNADFVRTFNLATHVHTLTLSRNPLRLGLALLGVAFHVVRGRYDVVIDLEYLTRVTAVLTALSRAPVRAGFHAANFWRGPFHTHRVPFTGTRHVRENFLAVGREAGFALSSETYARLALPSQASDAAGTLFDEMLVHDREWIVVNPNAGETAPERRWPAEHFTHLISDLLVDTDNTIVLIGADSERAYCECIQHETGNSDRVLNLAGRTSIADLARVLSGAALVISNDSGPAHLADHLGTPTLILFGPETPVLWGPLGAQSRVFYRGIACSPCINVHNLKTVVCRRDGAECLTEISPDTVFTAAQDMLAAASAREGVTAP